MILEPLSATELDELDRLLGLPLNMWRKGYHWQHAVEFDRVFARDAFGPPEMIRRLVAQARAASETAGGAP